MSKTEVEILRLLNKHKVIRGTANLAVMLGTKAKHEVYVAACLLSKHGLIHMQPGRRGRGNTTIYRDAGILQVKR